MRTHGAPINTETRKRSSRMPDAAPQSTYFERHELRGPGVEGERRLALVDAVAGEHPPALPSLRRRRRRLPVRVALRRRRRGPGVEVVGVARGDDGADGGGRRPGGEGRAWGHPGVLREEGEGLEGRRRRREREGERRRHFVERVRDDVCVCVCGWVR
jgi:hypothetical protein